MKCITHDDDSRTLHRLGQVQCRTAEITDAAYFVLLRSGTCGSWIDLELDIWRTLKDVADRPLERKTPVSDGSDAAIVASQLVVDALTDAVYRIALRHGFQKPFLDVELVLYRAVQRVICERWT
jgi:hypothetical protein